MAIDLITGHQGVSHISADQIATINNAMMDNFGANKVMRLVGGELTADGLTITISEGYWRVNGFDMEIQEGETLYIDPTTIGLSRIDDIYVEILQDIPTGAQRAEIYIALGEPSATPTAPDEPTAPYLNTDILLQIIKLARVTVSEGAMIMEDYSLAYNIVTPEDLAEVQTEVDTAETHATTALNIIRSFSNNDVYSPSKEYKVGNHVIYNNVLYKCITACSAGSWYVNKNCFEKTTLTTAVTELNSDLTLSATSHTIFVGAILSQGIGCDFILIPKLPNYKVVITEAYVKRQSEQNTSLITTTITETHDMECFQAVKINWETLRELEIVVDVKLVFHYEPK